MEENINKENNSPKGIVHVILSYEYSLFLIAIILGILCDHIFHTKIIDSIDLSYMGIFMIFIGSSLVYWAQRSTSVSKSKTEEERKTDFFYKGPYKYNRNPTHFGLFVMSLGLGFILNSVFSIIFIFIIHLIAKRTFLKKQDKILEERYGESFSSYKNKVKDWI
ncbi:TPA: hypothetical protein DIC38_00690 [Candidatus Nomurabacteria bacterium]|nr:MAG: hypothetical protein O210_OD1C00001G0590 [Parcubacteria bacterium RAAC4_OD1_1]HCY26188.1 hypothetical protein [Candidatus Nomurabacteria bacterium]